jgi:hypothetical protein
VARSASTLLICTALALIAAAPADAAISFGPPVRLPTGGAQPMDVVANDFNRDGAVDVATANTNSADVSVLLGDGQGLFGVAVQYPTGGAPIDIAAADFDGDARLDLAVADAQGHIAVLPGRADGAFGTAQIVQTSGSANRVAVGDVNGDGALDLISADFGPAVGDVSIELGDGVGGFGAPLTQNARGAPARLAVTEVNGDGLADVITADGGMQSVSVLPGNPDGSIGPIRSFQIGANTTGLDIADFNEDGNPDIAVGQMANALTVLLGAGGGDFPSQANFATPFIQPIGLVARDFDRDGHVDLVAAQGGIDTLRGTGTGSFEPAADDQPAPGALELEAADVDGDSLLEIVSVQGSELIVVPNVSDAGPPPLPLPQVARTANVAPVAGAVLVKQPGAGRFIRLEQANQIPIGSLVDTTGGTVQLTTAAGGGGTQTGRFRGGLFKLTQKRVTRPVTELRLAAKLRCADRALGPVGTAGKRRRSRRLFGNARGRFRSRGRNSHATIRGTRWLVKDTCRATLTRSLRGTVVVRDLVKRRKFTLRSGQQYVARSR